MNTAIHRLAAGCILWSALALVLTWGIPARAADSAQPAAPAAAAAATPADADADPRDPAALAELKRATDFLTALPRFHVRANTVYDVIQDDGRRLQFEKDGDIYLQRPDRLFAEVRIDDKRHRKFWYDGKMFSFAELSRKLHTQVKAPPTIDGMLDQLEQLFKEPMPLADLLYSDLTPVAQRAFEADIVGDSTINGRPCTHLTFRGETVDWQLWVEKGATPYIRKLVISYREEPGTPQFVARLDQWEIPAKFGEELFTFVAPAGSSWVNIMVPVAQPGQEGGKP